MYRDVGCHDAKFDAKEKIVAKKTKTKNSDKIATPHRSRHPLKIGFSLSRGDMNSFPGGY